MVKMTKDRLGDKQRARKETQKQLDKLLAGLPRNERLRAEVCMFVAVGYFDVFRLARTVLVVQNTMHWPT